MRSSNSWRDVETGAFCHGDAPTMADCCLVRQLYNARRFECDLTSFPTLVAIGERCDALLAFADALPERQLDAGRIEGIAPSRACGNEQADG
jgi:maleylacetoacetate isomerase/maleylpyruvate isomerase